MLSTLTLGARHPQPVRIGADGLAFGTAESGWFLSYAEIEAIEHTRVATVIRCRDRRRLPLSSARQAQLTPADVTDLFTKLESYGRESGPHFHFPERTRGPISVWVAAIRAAHSHGLHADLDRWALLQSVDDPATPPVHRATAALLLRNRLTTFERSRIANAAEETAMIELGATLRLILGAFSTEAEILAAIDQIGEHVSARRCRAAMASVVDKRELRSSSSRWRAPVRVAFRADRDSRA